jgi:hypothetical protein
MIPIGVRMAEGSKIFYSDGIRTLVGNWNKCTENQCDHMEK